VCLSITCLLSHMTIPRTYARAHTHEHTLTNRWPRREGSSIKGRPSFSAWSQRAQNQRHSLSRARARALSFVCACARACTQIKDNTFKIISGMAMRYEGTCNRSL